MRVPLISCLLLLGFKLCTGQTIFISPNGNDQATGSNSQPLKTLAKGMNLALKQSGKDVVIELLAGTYPIEKTIVVSAANYQLKSLSIRAKKGSKVLITGSKAYQLKWTAFRDNILSARLDLAERPDQIFINDHLLQMARYPNYDSTARVFNGTAADALSDDRISKWNNPTGGYIHALHQGEWGGFHYLITGKDAKGKLKSDGGWQNNRPSKMHPQHRYAEHIFEELDAPGEWFYDEKSKIIYLMPPAGVNIQTAKVTISTTTDILHFSGTAKAPIKNISITDIDFAQTARSFMLTKEPLLRSDWTIYRGAAILLDGTEQVSIKNCNFYNLGGNAIFLSNYNKGAKVVGNHIHNIGASAIAFVGDAAAVRSPAFRYENFIPWDEMDYTPGPKSNNYPQECEASNNLIHHTGSIEKQSAGVQISMSSQILISHNTIYHVPRAGINVSEGTWGGHVIEFNDVFDTVLETGDHGAFNSWGRDRFWRPSRQVIDSIVAARAGIELLDVEKPVIIRNNRFQCDHGWDIDLDDGSGNYEIYNNVCLSGGLKLREGYHRKVSNNIIINNTFHPHVWLKNSDDVFEKNIVSMPYAPIQMNSWGRSIDRNFFLTEEGLSKSQKLGVDLHSAFGDPKFLNEKTGNYQVEPNSPALLVGFKNFPMDFGVNEPRLKRITSSPKINPVNTKLSLKKSATVAWLGGVVKNIENLGERSAAGLHNNNGALIVQVPNNSIAFKNGLQKGDVIVKLDDKSIASIADLLKIYNTIKWKGDCTIVIVRNQTEQQLAISLKN